MSTDAPESVAISNKSNISSDTLYISTCPNHGAQFDQEGNVIQSASFDNQDPTLSLKQYAATIDNEANTVTIYGDDETELIITINIDIGDVYHTESNEIDNKGLLLYRKNENELFVLSRSCGHQGFTIDPFEEI